MQEAIIHAAYRRSMAAQYIFGPDDYRKGSGMREPSDAVWACNNCVFLTYCDSSNNSPEKQIDHNLNQLRGWLKRWRQGQPLVGHNEWHDFSIAYSDRYQVIALSVINGPDAYAQFHRDESRANRVACCATLPDECLLYLLRSGGTSLDLMMFLRFLWRNRGPERWSKPDVYNALEAYRGFSQKLANFKENWPGELSERRFWETVRPILRARAGQGVMRVSSGSREPISDFTPMSMINDMHLEDIYRFSWPVRKAMDDILPYTSPISPGPAAIAYCVRLEYYDFAFCVTSKFVDDGMDAAINAITALRAKQTNLRNGPILLFDGLEGEAHMMAPNDFAESHTQKLLAMWAAKD